MTDKILLKKVISGGQVGVDQAGLLAAKENYFLTGGWAPLGFRTRKGNQPTVLRDVFHLKEQIGGKGYRDRTWQNVQDSDGTLLFCNNFSSAGIRCTKNAIGFHQKPSFDVMTDMKTDVPSLDDDIYKSITKWLIEHKIKVLNIAGNSRPPSDIFLRSYRFLNGLFIYIRNQQGGDSFGRKRSGHSEKDARTVSGSYRRRQKVRRKKQQGRRNTGNKSNARSA